MKPSLEEGIVIETVDGVAKVKAMRHGDCKNCGACPSDDATVLSVRNPLDAKPGQKVAFEMQQSGMLKAAFVVYILPLLSVFSGVALGYLLSENTGLIPLLCQVAGGVIGSIISLLIIKQYDRYATENPSDLPVIKMILL